MAQRKRPRILLLDIETAPILGHVWKIWQENVGLNQIRKDWHILSWAAKWLGTDEKMYYRDQRRRRDVSDDKQIMLALWKLLDEADIVVAHNGVKFDIKKINARFIKHGITPPSAYKVVDTLRIVKARFALTSNRLDYVANYLGLEVRKSSHAKFPGHALWVAVLEGKEGAWEEMQDYNERDVEVLEALYILVRSWDRQHPNVHVHSHEEGVACPVCGSDHLEHIEDYSTNTGLFDQYRCKACGTVAHARQNKLPKGKRKGLLAL